MMYRPSNSPMERIRALFKRRVGDAVFAYLGDTHGDGARVDVPGKPGFVYIHLPNGADQNGNALYSTPMIARATSTAFLNYPGAGVYVAPGYDGELEIKSAHYAGLDQAGIDTRVLNPLNQQSKFVYPLQLTYGLPNAVATTLTGSFLVTVKSFLHFVGNSFQKYETPLQADKIDLESYVPATDEHRYAAIWIDTYTNTPTITTSTTQPLDEPMDLTDIQELVTGRPADGMPLKAFYLSDDQATLRQTSREVDLRQHMATPHIWGFPHTLTSLERVRPGYTLVVGPYTASGGGALTIETGGRVLNVHKSNVTGSAPTVSDDNTQGYDVGSRWFDSAADVLYIATSVATGAAVWETVTSLSAKVTDAATNTVTNVFTISHDSTGTPTTGFGTGLLIQGESSTTPAQDMARMRATWTTATHASRASSLIFSTWAIGVETDVLTLTPAGIQVPGNAGFGIAPSTTEDRVLIKGVTGADYFDSHLKVTNSANAQLFRISGDGRVSIGAEVGLNVPFQVKLTAGLPSGATYCASFQDGTGTVSLSSTSMATSSANFAFGSNGFGNTLEFIAPASNGMIRVNGANTTIGEQSLASTPNKTLKVYNSVATTGVTTFFVQEGAGQSAAEVFGVYANNGTTPRLSIANGLTTLTGTDTATNTILDVLTLNHASSGSAAGSNVFGSAIRVKGKSSATLDRDMAAFDVTWFTATDASRSSQIDQAAYYTTTKQVGFSVRGDTGGVKTSVNGVTPVAPQTYGVPTGTITRTTFDTTTVTLAQLAERVYALIVDHQAFGTLK